jgi:hypothetical protein
MFLDILRLFTGVPASVKRTGLERASTGAWDLRPLNQDEFWARDITHAILKAQVERGPKAGIRLRSLNV